MRNVPEGWAPVGLGEIVPADAPIIYGILQPGPDVPDGVPYVRPTEIFGHEICLGELRRTSPEIAQKYHRAALKADDVLLSIVGTIGKVARVPQELEGGNITQSSCRVRPDRKLVNSRFVEAFLRSPQATSQFREMSLGTAVPRLNLEDVRKISIPLPPLAEQRRIVAKLDALTARTARARADLGRLPDLAAHYRSAVLTAALRGDLTADWRDSHPTSWSTDDLRTLREVREKSAASRRGSRLRDVPPLLAPGSTDLPKSWASGCVSDVAELVVGYAFKSEWFSHEGPLLMRGANVAVGRVSWEDARRLRPDLAAEYSHYELCEGDIVIAMDRPLISGGLKIAQLSADDDGALLVQRVASPRPSPLVERRYLWWVLNSETFVGEIVRHAAGSDLPHISSNDILATPMPLPPLAEQREIAKRLDIAVAEIERLVAEAGNARRLLDRLDQQVLAKAFRGELVPQDPADEPASALLERIRAERAGAPAVRRRGRRPQAA